MRFLIDAQLPPALARWIDSQGHTAEHVSDIGLDAVPDSVIWDRAMTTKSTIISKDEGFARRRGIASSGPTVIWLRIGNTSRRSLLSVFASLFPEILAALQRGDTIIEIR